MSSTDYQAQAKMLYKGNALAPMVRASSTPLRLLALNYGADFVYTEELVDRNVTKTTRVVNKELGTIDYIKDSSHLGKKTIRKLAKENRQCLVLRIVPDQEKGRLVCQLGTGEPDLAVAAAKHVYQDFDAIDVNMGCPMKFSVSGGMGSALLKDPDRAARVVSSLRKEIPRPISCKIRLLETTEDTVNFIERMIAAGANAVAIHARRVGHDSQLTADWKTLRQVLKRVCSTHPDFPFLVNGDFYDRQECDQFVKETGVNGVLLGRPALYNTSIFRLHPQPLEDKTKVIQECLKLFISCQIHYKNAKYVISEMMGNRRAPYERVPHLPQNYPSGQTIASVCNCGSLEDLATLWNVDFAVAKTAIAAEQCMADDRKYDDAYILKRLGDAESSSESPTKKKLKVNHNQ